MNRTEALAHGNEIRMARIGVRAMLKNGEMTFAEALNHPACQTATVYSLLCAKRRVGRVTACEILRTIQASQVRLVNELTERQRGLLEQVA